MFQLASTASAISQYTHRLKRLTTVFIASALIAACSSGGGTDSGGGAAGSTTSDSGLRLTAQLSVNDSISVDSVRSICSPPAEGEPVLQSNLEPALPSTRGTINFNLTDTASTTGTNLFPRGVTLENYTVSFQTNTANGIALSPITFNQVVSIDAGGSATVTVTLVDIATTLRQFQARSSGSIVSYNVTVTYRGRSLGGEEIVSVSSTSLEIGNFDNC